MVVLAMGANRNGTTDLPAQKEQRALFRQFDADMERAVLLASGSNHSEASDLLRGICLDCVPRLYRVANAPKEAGGGATERERQNAFDRLTDFYRASGQLGNGPGAGSVTVNINLPTGDEAKAFLGRLAGEKSSRIVDVAAVKNEPKD